MKPNKIKTVKIFNEKHYIEIRQEEECLSIYFNKRYLGDIHFTAATTKYRKPIPQLFAIKPFKISHQLSNGNSFYQWLPALQELPDYYSKITNNAKFSEHITLTDLELYYNIIYDDWKRFQHKQFNNEEEIKLYFAIRNTIPNNFIKQIDLMMCLTISQLLTINIHNRNNPIPQDIIQPIATYLKVKEAIKNESTKLFLYQLIHNIQSIQ